MRIAFFGGSFDPPHVGHLRIAYAAATRLHLDRILLAPAALQPLKLASQAPPPASYVDRLAMLRLLLADDLRERTRSGEAPIDLQVSNLDAPRADGKPNYTYDTLVRLRAQLASEDRLFVLLGADSFLSLHDWHRAAELLLLADWIVATRPGFSLDQLEQALPPSILPCNAPEQFDGYLAQRLASADGPSSTLYLLPDLREDASATEIRAAFATGENMQPRSQQGLSPSVVAHIEKHGLYR